MRRRPQAELVPRGLSWYIVLVVVGVGVAVFVFVFFLDLKAVSLYLLVLLNDECFCFTQKKV